VGLPPGSDDDRQIIQVKEIKAMNDNAIKTTINKELTEYRDTLTHVNNLINNRFEEIKIHAAAGNIGATITEANYLQRLNEEKERLESIIETLERVYNA